MPCWYAMSMVSTVLPMPRRCCRRRGACFAAGAARCPKSSPQAVKDYLRLEIGVLEHEVFCVLLLDAQNRIIEISRCFAAR